VLKDNEKSIESRFNKGDLVRWITGHSVYEAYDNHLVGAIPIYSYGIIMEVSSVDPEAIIVNSCVKSFSPRLIILNGEADEIEILSNGASSDGK